jgi:hypothetical protein
VVVELYASSAERLVGEAAAERGIEGAGERFPFTD